MVAAGLPAADRRRVIIIGIAAATVMRILFAAVTVQLMQVVGLVLAGGLLLLWVSWKLWREIEERRKEAAAAKAVAEATLMATPDEESEASTESATEAPPRTTLRQAVVQIVIADLSMSLDNVLAVAGTCPCPWTTCWPWPVLHEHIHGYWSRVLYSPSHSWV
jgi:predicted tellurium resistance membrane protein TerC